MAHVHRAPYITLAGLTETSALITWAPSSSTWTRSRWTAATSSSGIKTSRSSSYPAAAQPTPDFAFAVIGDFGQGVKDPRGQQFNLPPLSLS